MKIKFRGICLCLSCLLAALFLVVMLPVPEVVPVHAQPSLLHSFYGSLTINGEPAPVGTEVEARVDGIFAGLTVTTVEGQYGNPPYEVIVVQGNIATNTPINFWVNGVDASQTYPFHPGETTALNLSSVVEYDNEAVIFPDGNLESVVREAISKLTGNIYHAHLHRLTGLYASNRDIVNLSGLECFMNLTTLYLSDYQINDISPLVANTGLGEGDEIDLHDNPLNADSINTYIPQLEGRGVLVSYDGSNNRHNAESAGK